MGALVVDLGVVLFILIIVGTIANTIIQRVRARRDELGVSRADRPRQLHGPSLRSLPVEALLRERMGVGPSGITTCEAPDGDEVELCVSHAVEHDVLLITLAFGARWETPAHMRCVSPDPTRPLALHRTALTWRWERQDRVRDVTGEGLWRALDLPEAEGLWRRLSHDHRPALGALTSAQLTGEAQAYTFCYPAHALGADAPTRASLLGDQLDRLSALAPELLAATLQLRDALSDTPYERVLIRLVCANALGLGARLDALELIQQRRLALYRETIEALLSQEQELTLVLLDDEAAQVRFAARLTPAARLALTADACRVIAEEQERDLMQPIKGRGHDGLMRWSEATIEAVGFDDAMRVLSRAPLGALLLIRHAASHPEVGGQADTRAALLRFVRELTRDEVQEILMVLGSAPRREDLDTLLWLAPAIERSANASMWWRRLDSVASALGRATLDDAHVKVITQIMRHATPEQVGEAVALIRARARPSHLGVIVEVIKAEEDVPAHVVKARLALVQALQARFADQLNRSAGGLSLADAAGGALTMADASAQGGLTLDE